MVTIMATETITLDQFPGWLEARARVLDGRDLSPLVKVVKQLLIADTQLNFKLGADPDGEPWAPLEPATLKKKGRGANPQPLRNTGILAASLAAGGGQFSVSTETATAIEWGTAVEYGVFHQLGTRNMAQRRFLGVGARLRAKIDRAIKDFADGLIGGHR